MEDRDVDLLLRQIGLRTSTEDGSQYDHPREEMIDRLMNMTMQCLGALRMIVVEDEKIRISNDSTDIDGSQRDDGKGKRIKRRVFGTGVQNMLDVILQGQELDGMDPLKDLVESFPWGPSIKDSGWLSLPWLLSEGMSERNNEEQQNEHIQSVQHYLSNFPESINEIDKKGQHYMTYGIRTNALPLLETLINQNKSCVKFKDGTGKQAIHYAAEQSRTVQYMYSITEAMGKPMQQIMVDYADDEGNLPIHCAANGCCTLDVMKEIIFSNPDAVRVPNKEGKMPLHLAAGKNDVEIVAALFAAFPNAVSVPDKTGWLPLYHAAFTSRSVDVIKFLHEMYPEAINKPHYSGRLPLHYAAVTCVSSKTMKYLIENYPDGAKTFDTNRRLPLHNVIARCTHMNPARLRCMRLLLEAYPSGAGMAGSDERTPLDLARRDDHGDLVLRLLLRADPDQDPEALGEISYAASKAKYKRRKAPGENAKMHK